MRRSKATREPVEYACGKRLRTFETPDAILSRNSLPLPLSSARDRGPERRDLSLGFQIEHPIGCGGRHQRRV